MVTIWGVMWLRSRLKSNAIYRLFTGAGGQGKNPLSRRCGKPAGKLPASMSVLFKAARPGSDRLHAARPSGKEHHHNIGIGPPGLMIPITRVQISERPAW